ncbi:UpxY family transcription antiterminator [Phaeodactylibacter luteus]|uniref:UpxY family transcription antiterminator n=1 Tax=Phaeodactylibacter luteus TaxID=1564516 RepID=A0A5C6S526_9BACT|nr:UpxY family transcription antiterminator [Phaeodactylibacter luteus]TXB68911.1 UpxY family transcription antiterminator [Phaeodactylibacter luteus]
MSIAAQEKKENHLSNEEARWFAVYTNFKREKMVAKRLAAKGIEHFLPLQKVTRKYTRKVKHLELPLINCYVFVKIKKQEYVPVLETDDVLRFVTFSRNLISIPEREIDILRLIIGEEVEMEVQQGTLAVGDQVEIIGGSMTGVKGILMGQQNEKNFVVALETMGYSIHMAIEPSRLKRIKAAAAPAEEQKQDKGGFKKYL